MCCRLTVRQASHQIRRIDELARIDSDILPLVNADEYSARKMYREHLNILVNKRELLTAGSSVNYKVNYSRTITLMIMLRLYV